MPPFKKVTKLLLSIMMISNAFSSHCQPTPIVSKQIHGNMWRGRFKNDRPIGTWIIFNDENIAVERVIYKLNNQAILSVINQRGGTYSVSYCVVDQKDYYHLIPNGPDSNFYDNGKVRTVKVFKNGKAEGISIYISETGDTLAIDHFKGGKYTGESKEFYNRTKKLKTDGWYQDNNKSGVWTEYYPNGQMKSQGEFYPQSKWLDYSAINYKLIIDSLKRSFLDTSQIAFPLRVFFKNKKWCYWLENGKLYLEEWWNNGKYLYCKKSGSVTKG